MNEKERLTELFQIAEDMRKEGGSIDDSVNFLLESGVIVLPVNMIGNTLWFINCDDNIVCDKIDGITISDRHGVYIFLQKSDNEPYELSDIGKFLFLTREEAEKALAERKNEHET